MSPPRAFAEPPLLWQNGVLDPYVKASLGGVFAKGSEGKERSKKELATAHPQFFETLSLQTWLPPLELAPALLIDAWDADEGWGDSDDFVGTTHLSLLSASVGHTELPPPEWVALRPRRHEGGGGQLLIRLELLPLDPAPRGLGSGTPGAQRTRHALLTNSLVTPRAGPHMDTASARHTIPNLSATRPSGASCDSSLDAFCTQALREHPRVVASASPRCPLPPAPRFPMWGPCR